MKLVLPILLGASLALSAQIPTKEELKAKADAAASSDGKLTVVGGGWSLTGPDPVPFGIAILIRVPWDPANQRHVMRLELLDILRCPGCGSGRGRRR